MFLPALFEWRRSLLSQAQRESALQTKILVNMRYTANQSNALVGLHEVVQAAKQYHVASPYLVSPG
jgi:hypothetical protein